MKHGFEVDPDNQYIDRNGLSSEILVLRANLEYYGVEFSNLGEPRKRTVHYSVPKDYTRGSIPLFDAMRILPWHETLATAIDDIDIPKLVKVDSHVWRLEIESVLNHFIVLNDLYDAIIKEEARLNGPISKSAYSELWKDFAKNSVVIVRTERNEVLTTDDMAKRVSKYFKVISQTTQM